jgi:hypothetical protein
MEAGGDMRICNRYPAIGAILIVIGLCGAAAAQDDDAAGVYILNPLAKLDPLSFKAFLQRPLFSADRRAPEDLVTLAAATTDTDSLNIRLLGVIVTPDAVVARIADVADSKIYSLRQGEDFQDWTVMSLDANGLKLGKNGEIKTFTVFAKSSQAPDVTIAAKPGAAEDQPDEPDATQQVGFVAKEHSPEQDLVDFFGPAKVDRQSP